MITPTININGSSIHDLVNPRLAAMDHLMAATEALRQTAPNGRDYPGDHEGLQRDRELHFRRLEEIKCLREELMREAVRIKF